MTSSASTTVVLSLAHLLQQHSLSYDDEKNALLDASVKKAVGISKALSGGGEVHVVMTGSPRPTFAETNAWLLEDKKGPETPRVVRKKSVDGGNNMDIDASGNLEAGNEDVEMTNNNGESTLQEYITESTHNSSTKNANMNDLCGSPTKIGGSVLSHYQERKRSNTNGSIASLDGVVSAGEAAAGGGTIATTTNNDNQKTSDSGPMVGHAVVNAISQTEGVGLYSRRAQLLQGTIDRPLWDQRRWTDGECLFSDLVERVGLESFENVGVAGKDRGAVVGSGLADSGDIAAGGQQTHASSVGEVGSSLHKTTNLSAHLITVPATLPTSDEPGMEESTIDEIARGILRALKRKKSPLVSKVFLALPPVIDNNQDAERRELVLMRLSQAWEKLERYNDMIGLPKFMAGAEIEFVSVVAI